MRRLLSKLAIAVACALSVAAQTPGDARQVSATNAASDALIPPPAPVLKSPVERFRELLAMPPLERRVKLAMYSPENRRAILEKIREYQAMSAEQRAVQLEVTELRWYLWPLMKMPATNRTERLESMPAEMRKLVEERLRIWDLLPPTLQQELLQNVATASFMSEIAAGTRTAANSPGQFETNTAAWQAMPEYKRRQISLLFSNFFRLNPQEQEKILRHLSPEEYRQIEKTLEVFQGLTPPQRSQCVRSFEKFAGLSPQERKEFLANAQRWESMPEADRQFFRNFVEQIASQPPLPMTEAPLPPRPRPMVPHLPATATNQ